MSPRTDIPPEGTLVQETQSSCVSGATESVGSADGLLLGRTDGLAEGSAEGILLGKAEGRLLGRADGFADGCIEGAGVGEGLGYCFALGSLVGLGLIPQQAAPSYGYPRLAQVSRQN